MPLVSRHRLSALALAPLLASCSKPADVATPSIDAALLESVAKVVT